MTKYLTIAFHTNLLFTFVGYTLQNEVITYLGYVLVLPILFLLYATYRKWQFNKIDKVMYVAFIFGFLSDLFAYTILGDLAIIIQIFCSLMSNLLFFYIFRIESPYIIFTKNTDFWKFLFPLFPCFSYVGTILITNIKDENIYFLTGFYVIFSYLFLLTTLYLSVNFASKLLAIIGVIFRIINDTIFSYITFLHFTGLPLLLLNFVFYAYAQYFIVLSVLTSGSNFFGDKDEYLKAIPNPIMKVLDKIEYYYQLKKG